MSKLTLKSTWSEILGEDSDKYSDEQRRERWEEWKRMAIEAGDREVVEFWTENYECDDCIYKNGDWCKLMELPVTINPILTMYGGMIGFACMGAGYEPPGQKELEFEGNE